MKNPFKKKEYSASPGYTEDKALSTLVIKATVGYSFGGLIYNTPEDALKAHKEKLLEDLIQRIFPSSGYDTSSACYKIGARTLIIQYAQEIKDILAATLPVVP